MSKPRIGIIVGSTRPGRFADHPAKWIHELAGKRDEFEVELLDLRDWPMPFFDEATSPAWGPSKNEVAQRWQKKIDSLDGFIVIAAEYNRGPTAVLKNALDYGYKLQMAPIRAAVHIQFPVYLAVLKGEKGLNDFPEVVDGAKTMLDQFVWWLNALKHARDAEANVEKKAA
jgi:NAD(P)H-dependent FMN reductase